MSRLSASPFNIQRWVSDMWRWVSQLSDSLPPRGWSEEKFTGAECERCLAVRPRFLCHRLVATDEVQSVNSYAVVNTGRRSAEQVAAWCPRQHMLSSHLLFLYETGRRREEGWPLLNVVLVGLALNFRQSLWGWGGGVTWPQEEEERLFGIQQHAWSLNDLPLCLRFDSTLADRMILPLHAAAAVVDITLRMMLYKYILRVHGPWLFKLLVINTDVVVRSDKQLLEKVDPHKESAKQKIKKIWPLRQFWKMGEV